jgi:hypothetical protein
MTKPDWYPIYDSDLILYTMEKCGSTTVLKTVESAGIEIFRATHLTINTIDFEHKKIITIARDPIEWAISYYFEMPDAHPDDLIEPENFGTIDNFHKNVDPRYPESWFIHKFREIIGVNVYAKWFRKRLGWETYSLERVLVLVTHRLEETLIPALAHFTERDESEFTLHPWENTLGANRFGSQYTEFIKQVKYQRLWLIDNILDTQYCKQFFSLEERKRMLEKWAK